MGSGLVFCIYPSERNFCQSSRLRTIPFLYKVIEEPGKKQDLTPVRKIGMIKELEKLGLNYRILTLFLPASLAR